MTVLVWVVEDTFEACVDAVREAVAPTEAVQLLHVTSTELPWAAEGAFAGLLGRGRSRREPGARVAAEAETAGRALLDAAAARLGPRPGPVSRIERTGRPEREVAGAARNVRLLVLARDGDRTRPGPASLGPQARFVVDHAPTAVMLVWQESAPLVDDLPPPPPHRGHPPPPTGAA